MGEASSIIKQGTGTLTLTADNTGTFTGATTIDAGTVAVSGSGTLGPITVDLGANLKGNGHVFGNVIDNGTVKPGNSIGTLTITGNYTQATGSTFEVELSPSVGDLLAVNGMVTIDPGSTIALIPDVGSYTPDQAYTIITATGGVTGQFDTLTISLPTFSAEVFYFPTFVELLFDTLPFNQIVSGGNAGKVAACLDKTPAPSGSDLLNVENMLRFMTIAQMQNTLDQMHPALFNAMSLAQENSILQVQEAVTRRLEYVNRCGCRDDFWTDYSFTRSHQDNVNHQIGYNTLTQVAVAGSDHFWTPRFYTGILFGYSYDRLKWHKERGEGKTNSYYLDLYGGWRSRHFYTQLFMLGSLNYDQAKRNIHFVGSQFSPDQTRTAKHSVGGSGYASRFELGFIFGKKVQIRPFGRGDYIFVHRKKFKESGAQSIDLTVFKYNADLLRAEGGIELFSCFRSESTRWISYGKIGYVVEKRFFGKYETGQLANSACHIHVKGLKPDRYLIAPTGGLTLSLLNNRLFFTGEYEAEWGSHYWNRTMSAQMRFCF